MDGILRALFALIAALDAATGAPVDVDHLPDRPPIAAPTIDLNPVVFATSTPSGRGLPSTVEIFGKISLIRNTSVVVNGHSIVLVPNTQIKGQLDVGASVKVEATKRADGELEAKKLEVSDDLSAVVGTAKPTEPPQARETEKPEIKPTEQVEVKPTEKLEAKPTEAPEVKPSEQPEVKPTEKPEGDGGSDSSKSGSNDSGSSDDSEHSDSDH